MNTTKRTIDDYAIAWVCPLRFEQIAALAMLDEQHEYLPQAQEDKNLYFFGNVKGHNIVIASLPERPRNTAGSAARVVAQLTYTFPALRVILLIGVGGGVPTTTDEGPIRLGHVIVSKRTPGQSSIYIHPPQTPFTRAARMKEAPAILHRATERFAVLRDVADADPITGNVLQITSKPKLRTYSHPGAQYDRLYNSKYQHVDKDRLCQECCDETMLQARRQEDEVNIAGDREVVIHQGRIALGDCDREGSDAEMRDKLAREEGILCFDTEADGLWPSAPVLIIRGIVDYADSHGNDRWHKYGAAVAAACAREVTLGMSVEEIKNCVPWKGFGSREENLDPSYYEDQLQF